MFILLYWKDCHVDVKKKLKLTAFLKKQFTEMQIIFHCINIVELIVIFFLILKAEILIAVHNPFSLFNFLSINSKIDFDRNNNNNNNHGDNYSIIQNNHSLDLNSYTERMSEVDNCGTTLLEEVAIDLSWEDYFKQNSKVRYQVIAGPNMERFAEDIVKLYPSRFKYHKTEWEKFPDGTDRIVIGGFQPQNHISGQNIIMLASFHDNGVTLSQFSVMITLLQSFIESLTIILPFYPVGTMERVVEEGQVATANTYAQMLSNLPSCGKPTRLIVYDLHTLQNRFYLHGHAIASLQTTIPLLIKKINTTNINCIAFPDDGAAKRFSYMFEKLGHEVVTCGKHREGEKRIVIIQDGNPEGKNVIIVDDLVQTGGTLYECSVALKKAGANSVSAFVAHGVFPKESWRAFMKGGPRHCFEKFYLTNSIPTVSDMLPKDDVFEVISLVHKIVDDLDAYS